MRDKLRAVLNLWVQAVRIGVILFVLVIASLFLSYESMKYGYQWGASDIMQKGCPAPQSFQQTELLHEAPLDPGYASQGRRTD